MYMCQILTEKTSKSTDNRTSYLDLKGRQSPRYTVLILHQNFFFKIAEKNEY